MQILTCQHPFVMFVYPVIHSCLFYNNFPCIWDVNMFLCTIENVYRKSFHCCNGNRRRFFKMINQCVLLLTCIPLSNKIQLLTSVYEVEHCVDVLGTFVWQFSFTILPLSMFNYQPALLKLNRIPLPTQNSAA